MIWICLCVVIYWIVMWHVLDPPIVIHITRITGNVKIVREVHDESANDWVQINEFVRIGIINNDIDLLEIDEISNDE